MTLLRFWSVTIISASIAACATPYNRAVTLLPVNERVYEITSAGNSDTSIGRIRDYAKLAAAETCLRNGFSHYSELASELAQKTGATFIAGAYGGGMVIPYSTYNRASRVYFHKKGETAPPAATNCQLVYNALAPKYIRP